VVKTRSHAERIPGSERGSVTVRKVVSLVARRSIAASSTVESMDLRIEEMVIKAMGNIPTV